MQQWTRWERCWSLRHEPIYYLWTRGNALLQSKNLERQVPQWYQATHVLHWLRSCSLLSLGRWRNLFLLLTGTLLSIRKPMRFGWARLPLSSVVVDLRQHNLQRLHVQPLLTKLKLSKAPDFLICKADGCSLGTQLCPSTSSIKSLK